MNRERIGTLVLRAYPAEARLARGPEMLSMLLDAGATSRVAFARECGSLVLSGFRERAAIGVRRHAWPLVVVDCVLVALAYFVAFRLRFPEEIPARYAQLLSSSILWVAVGTVIVLALFGTYQRRRQHVRRRDYLAVVKGVLVSTILAGGVLALLRPVQVRSPGWEPRTPLRGGIPEIVQLHLVPLRVPVVLPSFVIALFLLLTLALLLFVRFVVHLRAGARRALAS